MRRIVRWTAAALLALAALPGASIADDQGVVGLKLIMIDKYGLASKAKLTFVSKDTTAGAIHNGSGSGNGADLSGTVRVCPTADPSNVAVYGLPSPWLTNKPTVSKYVNKTAAPGGPGVKVTTVKPGLVLKVVAKNLGDGDAASGNDSATDLNLNDPPGTCTLNAGDTVEVEVTVDDAAASATHRMCAQFTVDSAASIAGGTGCKVISRTSAAGTCGVCGGGATTTTTTSATTTSTSTTTVASTTTTTTTSTTTTTVPATPLCAPSLPSPPCDGDCGGPGAMCVDPGGGCVCMPTGGPCGTVVGPPTCYGDCFLAGQACVDIGGTCACMDAVPPPACAPGLPPPFCEGSCGPGAMCADPGGGCMCVPTGGPCGTVAPFPVCLGDCPPGLSCRGAFPAAPPGCACLP